MSLQYAGEAGCPDLKDFEALVSARLGYDPFADSAPDHVLVRVESQDRTLEGHIEWRDSAGKWAGDQSIPAESHDCSRLARALATALAVQIQLLATTASPAADTASRQSTPPPPEAPAARSDPRSSITAIAPNRPPAVSERSRPRPAFALGAGTSVALGMSSVPVPLGRVLGALAWPHRSLELAAEASLPTTTRRADGAGFSQQHLLAGVSGCSIAGHWSACLLAKVGEVRMAGENIDRPTSATVPIFQAGARAGISQLLAGRLFVDAHADGLVNVVRWTATLDQVPVWTAPRFAAVVGIDFGVRLR